MSIDCKIVVVDTADWEAIKWEWFGENEEKVKKKFWKFVEENPMPKSVVFKSPEDLLDDILNAKGVVALPLDENKEFLDWLCNLIDELLD